MIGAGQEASLRGDEGGNCGIGTYVLREKTNIHLGALFIPGRFTLLSVSLALSRIVGFSTRGIREKPPGRFHRRPDIPIRASWAECWNTFWREMSLCKSYSATGFSIAGTGANKVHTIPAERGCHVPRMLTNESPGQKSVNLSSASSHSTTSILSLGCSSR